MPGTPFAEVIGDPIAHSKSPIIHRFWLQALGIEADYVATRVTADGLAAHFRLRRDDPDWRGSNVTLPHKQAVFDVVDDRAGLKTTLGALNCVFGDADGGLVGTNTDAGGFLEPLDDVPLEGKAVAVVGAGGAARAVLLALASRDVGSVTLLNRTPDKGRALLNQFGLQGDAVPLDTALPPVDLLVNASSLGMVGQPPLALDLTPLPAGAIVYDIVYAPLETPLLAAARARGLTTIDGLTMLIGQAALAFEIFFEAHAPRDRDAELRALLTAA
ncbi:shikimate dehydrogenase [Sphingomonas montana]|uniref:shikimate dehydrogenase n=1 Tax=Sphingomonas montana TaxID=1843236 RepID=UPI00096FF5C3|nr:shikimate dehydrogenase [Sphingomonas montana]